MTDSYKCQQCGRPYRIAFLVSDKIWKQIKPRKSSDGCDHMCGSCIALKIEVFVGYRAFKVTEQE